MPHPVVHAEIRSSDPEGTREFLGKLFGWGYSDGGYPGYTFVVSGAEGGPPTAISPLQAAGDQVLFFVGVDDVAGALSKAEALGGSIVQPAQHVPGERQRCCKPPVMAAVPKPARTKDFRTYSSLGHPSADLLRQLDDDPRRAAHVAEPVAVLVVLQLADQLAAMRSQAGEGCIDVVDDEEDVADARRVGRGRPLAALV